MFRNNINKTIVDPSALFNLLKHHLAGSVKAAIELCIFSAASVNRYERAMEI